MVSNSVLYIQFVAIFNPGVTASQVSEKPVVWYPGAAVEQIERAVLRAALLPPDADAELLDPNGCTARARARVQDGSRVLTQVQLYSY